MSSDVESDGPIPGKNSMRSVGTAVFTLDKKLIGSFEANLLPMKGAEEDPNTMEFWAKNPDAWAITTENAIDPKIAMIEYAKWLSAIKKLGIPVFMGYPAGFDFTFVRWYLHYFVGVCDFGFQALDLKSLAVPLLRKPYKQCVKKVFPKRWFLPHMDHTHVALDDALEQGNMGINMLRESFGMQPLYELDLTISNPMLQIKLN